MSFDLAVIGGGPAGCAAAITAARAGNRVAIFEVGRYPRHKVCGEFISPESHIVLRDLLGADHDVIRSSPRISRARMFADGDCLEFDLHAPALSISRFDLDFALWQAAIDSGANCFAETKVESIDHHVLITTRGQFQAKQIVNATGRWSNLNTPALPANTPRWIGIKAHFTGEDAPASTDIYFFSGGYCGIQPVGEGTINASAMVRSEVATSLDEVFALHRQLETRSRAWQRATTPVTTAPLIHRTPQPVTNDVMNAGDAAAFIDPFVGDGIALALRTGVLAAECSIDGGPARYGEEYHRLCAHAFRTAAFVRMLTRAPFAIRRAAALAFRSKRLRQWAWMKTRSA